MIKRAGCFFGVMISRYSGNGKQLKAIHSTACRKEVHSEISIGIWLSLGTTCRPMITPSPKVRYGRKALRLRPAPCRTGLRIAQEHRGKKINAPSACGADQDDP